MDTLIYTYTPTVTEINRNFVIKWRHTDEDTKWNRLMGAGKYAEKFGDDLRDKHFTKAMDSLERKVVIKVRGRFIITFASR